MARGERSENNVNRKVDPASYRPTPRLAKVMDEHYRRNNPHFSSSSSPEIWQKRLNDYRYTRDIYPEPSPVLYNPSIVDSSINYALIDRKHDIRHAFGRRGGRDGIHVYPDEFEQRFPDLYRDTMESYNRRPRSKR